MKSESFSQPSVILERPALWSRLFVWLLVSSTASAIFWAALAKIDQTVVATGKLEPNGAVKEIKAPTGGVVREIHVKDGEAVKKDKLLITFDPTAPEADLNSLRQVRSSLIQENQFYDLAIEGKKPLVGSSDLIALLKLRADLLSENRYYQALINGPNPKTTTTEFNTNQNKLLAASRAEVRSKVTAARLQIQELEKQRSQAQEELATAKQVLTVNQGILKRITPLATGEGAISQIQYERQKQDVFTKQGDVRRLTDEVKRLAIAIDHAKEDLQNTVAGSQRDILSRVAENQKKISEIDTQLSRTRLDNKKKIAEIDAQISKAVQSLQYQQIKAPVNGIVFDLQPRSPGFVVGETQAIMKIVPNENLVASVYLTNKDIGFVREGMTVDVRVDSFPSTEFGSIKGKLISLGSDALAPTQERQFYAFPATIELERQILSVNGKPISLQSGMSVNASIIVRKRPILSILTDLFDKQVKGIESMR
ncbi:MAG TPA: hemolysin D [Cyanobacteria bacterium UBA11049]|nr:hemolysin D [Cyanobacteria bacterium UBA11049]